MSRNLSREERRLAALFEIGHQSEAVREAARIVLRLTETHDTIRAETRDERDGLVGRIWGGM